MKNYHILAYCIFNYCRTVISLIHDVYIGGSSIFITTTQRGKLGPGL